MTPNAMMTNVMMPAAMLVAPQATASVPLVSIVIRSYNCAPYVAAAIESALAQTHPRIEIVVVDDGSEDGTLAVLARYRSRIALLAGGNGGQADAINRGFLASSGDYLWFLDGDDLLEPHAVASALAMWRCGTLRLSVPLRAIDAAGRDIGRLLRPEAALLADKARIHRYPELAPHVPTSGNMFAREVLSRILPMPVAEWRQAPDLYLNVLSALAGPVQVAPAPLARYRVHRGSASMRWPAQLALLRDRTQAFPRLETAARRLGLAPQDVAGMIPSLHHALLRVLSFRLDRRTHGFPGDSRLSLLGLVARSAFCPRKVDVRHWRRGVILAIAIALLFAPQRLLRERYDRILVGPRFQAVLRREARDVSRRDPADRSAI